MKYKLVETCIKCGENLILAPMIGTGGHLWMTKFCTYGCLEFEEVAKINPEM